VYKPCFADAQARLAEAAGILNIRDELREARWEIKRGCWVHTAHLICDPFIVVRNWLLTTTPCDVHTLAPPPQTHTHTYTRACACAHTFTHTHTHTHTYTLACVCALTPHP
jgi:hypothetical protein